MARFEFTPEIVLPGRKGGPLQVVGWVDVSALSVTHALSFDSSAELTIPSADSGLKVGDCLRIPTPIRSGDLFSVRSISVDYIKNQTKVSCISLADAVLSSFYINGEITPSDMGGSRDASAFMALGAAAEYVNPDALAQYATWDAYPTMNVVIPDITTDPHIRARGVDVQAIRNGWSFSNVTVKDAFMDVIGCIPQCEFSIRYVSDGASVQMLDLFIDPAQPDLIVPECEMRLGRNLTSLSVKVDKSGMFNVLYAKGRGTATISRCESKHSYRGDDPDNPPAGVPDLWHTKGEEYAYDLDSLRTWGPVTKQLTESSRYLSTADNRSWFTDWAFAELTAHSHPKTTINCSALELMQVTGSTWDKLTPGAVVQIPLPQYGTVFTDVIRSVTFGDLVKDPMSCTVTVANDTSTFKTLQYRQQGGSGSGRRKVQAQTDNSVGKVEDYTDGLRDSTSARVLGGNARWQTMTIGGKSMMVMTRE